MIGHTLGHYRIVAKMGAGGMGEVYKARDERLERDVALKILPAGVLVDEGARKRFRKEALALSKLNHPNIATIYDFDTESGVDFIVMEHVAGETLAEKAAGGALPEKEVAALGGQIAEALEEAHEHGIVHRDLKPGNIMVTPKGRAKVLDFGLAKLLRPSGNMMTAETLSETRGVAGTLPYMAPEQLQGEQVDARSDIFSYGAVLYEMATGQRPFREVLTSRLTDAILHQSPVPPRALNPRTSPELERIIVKCLEKEPERRFQSAKDLSVDLRRLGAPTAAVAPASAKHARSPAHRAVAASSTALIVFLVVFAALNIRGWRDRLLGRTKAPRIESLAVLPLENLSHDPSQDYFADGMTEELITNLAKVHGLRVISRTSVMQYRGTTKPLRQIGAELNVNAVVEGSVLRSGDRVRITAQLIRADTDTHLWAESYDRELRDVLSLQNEVARAITNEIRVELTPQEQQWLAATRRVNFDTYQDYLQGRYFWNKRDPASIKKAVDYFEQATQKDPNYALPYAGLGDSYPFLNGLTAQEVFAKSTAAYTKAAELDTGLAEPHAGLGLLLLDTYQWANSEQEFRRAIELNPGYATAHQWYSNLLAILGRKEEAKAEILKALELDPLSPIINTTLGYRLAEDERYDDAITQFRKVLEINPNFWTAHYALGETYLEKGMFKEGIAELRTEQILLGYKPDKVNREAEALSEAYGKAGSRGYWQKRLQLAVAEFKRQRLGPSTEVSRAEIASYFARLGEREQALHWLNESYGVREAELGLLRIDPAFKDLRSDPRFQDLLRSIGLPP